MRGINQLFLLGTLHDEPETLTSRAGKNYVKFELVVLTVRRKDQMDEEQREVVPVTAFGKLRHEVTNTGPPGPPTNGNGTRQGPGPGTAKNPGRIYRTLSTNGNREPPGTPDIPRTEPNEHDLWIERYLSYLTVEHTRLGEGPIGQHYLKCAAASYREFQAIGTQESRFRTWLGIRTLCQWLCQLRKGDGRS
jgi:single-stranded DNA-binding protein